MIKTRFAGYGWGSGIKGRMYLKKSLKFLGGKLDRVRVWLELFITWAENKHCMNISTPFGDGEGGVRPGPVVGAGGEEAEVLGVPLAGVHLVGVPLPFLHKRGTGRGSTGNGGTEFVGDMIGFAAQAFGPQKTDHWPNIF